MSFPPAYLLQTKCRIIIVYNFRISGWIVLLIISRGYVRVVRPKKLQPFFVPLTAIEVYPSNSKCIDIVPNTVGGSGQAVHKGPDWLLILVILIDQAVKKYSGVYVCIYNIYSGVLYISILYIYLALFFCHPIYYLRPSVLSPSYLVVTQIRGHIAGSSPPLPTTVRALHFYRDKISALSSLVDLRRTAVLTHARRSQQLILFLKKKCK